MTNIPQTIIDSLDRYANHGIPTGSFLRAFLENNLYKATLKADEQNIHNFRSILTYIVETLPYTSYGSEQTVIDYINSFKSDEELSAQELLYRKTKKAKEDYVKQTESAELPVLYFSSNNLQVANHQDEFDNLFNETFKKVRGTVDKDIDLEF